MFYVALDITQQIARAQKVYIYIYKFQHFRQNITQANHYNLYNTLQCPVCQIEIHDGDVVCMSDYYRF